MDLHLGYLLSFFRHFAKLLLDQGMIFVDVKGVLNDGSVYPSEVLYGPCEDVIVVMQEIDELGLGFAI